MSKTIQYSWQDFDNSITALTKSIKDSCWTPDYIVGVKRGGLIPAVRLSHIFNKPLIMMSCQLRDSNDKEVRLYEVEEISKENNILIVDDICDSGSTLLQILLKLILSGFKKENIKTCSLVYNAAQVFAVDYYNKKIDRTIDDEWIIFPWENV